jgi:hypothetical protein
MDIGAGRAAVMSGIVVTMITAVQAMVIAKAAGHVMVAVTTICTVVAGRVIAKPAG